MHSLSPLDIAQVSAVGLFLLGLVMTFVLLLVLNRVVKGADFNLYERLRLHKTFFLCDEQFGQFIWLRGYAQCEHARVRRWARLVYLAAAMAILGLFLVIVCGALGLLVEQAPVSSPPWSR